MFRLSLKSPKELGAAEYEEQVPLNLRRVRLLCWVSVFILLGAIQAARAGQVTANVDMSSDPATNPICGGTGGCLQFFDIFQRDTAHTCTGVNSTATTQNNPTCSMTVIRAGDLVKWTMRDSSGPHGTESGNYTTCCAGDGVWTSPTDMNTTTKTTFTTSNNLTTQGVYPYFCEFHLNAMIGNVVVQDYQIAISPTTNFAYAGATSNFTATLTAFPSGPNATIAATNNFVGFQAPAYNSSVNMSCTTTALNCNAPGATTPTTGGTATAFSDSGEVQGDYPIRLDGTGLDPSTLQRSSPTATLHVVNLSMTTPANVTIGGNDSSGNKTTSVSVTTKGTFPAGGVTFSCEPLAGVSCSFNPPSFNPPAANTVTPVTVTVTTSGLAAGNHIVTIDATPGSPLNATPIKKTFTVASVGDFSMAVTNGAGSPPTITVPKNTVANFNGTLTALLGYSAANSITITCGAGAPATCNGSSHTTGAGTVTLISAMSAVNGTFNFTICGTGNDAAAVTHCVPVILSVGGFTLANPSTATINNTVGNPSALATFDIVADPTFSSTVSLSCSGLPAGGSCKFYPSSSPLVSGNTVTVSFSVTTGSATTPGSYPITVNGTGGGSTPPGQGFTLNVAAGTNSADLRVAINPTAATGPLVAFGSPVKINFAVTNTSTADSPTATLIIAFDQQLPAPPSFTGGLAGACTGTGPYICPVLSVINPNTRTVTATFPAPFVRSLQANAQVFSADTDTNAANNSTSNPAKGLVQIRPKPFGLNFQVPLLP